MKYYTLHNTNNHPNESNILDVYIYTSRLRDATDHLMTTNSDDT